MKTSIELQQANIQLRTILRGTIKRSLNNSLENQREVDLTRKKLKGSLRAAHSHALFQIQTTYKNLFYSKRDLSNYISSYFTNTVDKEIQWFFNNKTKKNQSSVSKPEDDYIFDENGNFLRIEENDQIDKIIIECSDTCKKEGVFKFNDLLNDTESIKLGQINKLNVISLKDINSEMSKIKVPKEENRWVFIERESRPFGDESLLSGKSSGKLDFFYNSSLVKENEIHVISGINMAFNDKDFGNFLWGQAGKKLGFSISTLQLAANVNNAVNGASDNPGIDVGILDSKTDQQAIRSGYYYPKKRH